MRVRVNRFAVAAAFALVLVSAAPAAAVIPCEDCYFGYPPWTHCVGSCEGQVIRFCFDWIRLGCPELTAVEKPLSAEDAEEAFIRSLQAAPDDLAPRE